MQDGAVVFDCVIEISVRTYVLFQLLVLFWKGNWDFVEAVR